jgi:TolB protein
MIRRLVLLTCCVLALSGAAQAQIILGGEPVSTAPGASTVAAAFPVDADAPGYKPLNLAVPTFSGASSAEVDTAKNVSDVIAADVASLGLFTAPAPGAFDSLSASVDALPAWGDWGGAGVDVLILGKTIISESGQLTIQFRVYDVAGRKQILGTSFTAPASTWRRLAHKSADAILVALVGGKPGLDSRLVYATAGASKAQLAFVDADGGNAETLPASIMRLQSPRAARNSQTIAYSADAPIPGKTQAQRTTILYDLLTGRRDPMTTGAQPNADARFSPLDGTLIYSRKAGANTDIYTFTTSRGKETRLTDDPAADTEPSLSPDGLQFAFVSARGGSEQIHVARVDGTPVTCADGTQARACPITQGGDGAMTPVWSPRGDWIAYVRENGDDTAIHIVRPDGSEARALTNMAGASDLSPSWSPEGRRIAFARLLGERSQIAIIGLDGGEPRKVATPGDAFDPDWGPVLP